MIEINKYKLVPAITATWGDITGDITKQQDLVDYVATHGGGGDAVWGSITGDIGDQEDLNALLANYAMKEWVENKGYITSSALSGYATQEWVEGQDYYAPETAHAPVEYHDLAEDPDIEFEYPGYNPKTKRLIEPGVDGFVIGDYYDATGPTINPDEIRGIYFGKNQDGQPIAGKYSYYMYEKPAGVFTPTEEFYPFVTEDDLSGYATKSWVNNKSYATQKWVNDKGYITSAALSGYATEKWVGQQGYIDQIKTVNNQSLVGEGNITISGLTPAQEAAIAPLEETSEGMLYTLDVPSRKEVDISFEYVTDSSYAGRLYYTGGKVYYIDGYLFEFDDKSLSMIRKEYFNGDRSGKPLWVDSRGRFYCGIDMVLNFADNTIDSIDMGCTDYYYDWDRNKHSIWEGQNGIYNLNSDAWKFDESTQTFNSWPINRTDCIGNAKYGVWYDGHYVWEDGNHMYELTEYDDRLEVTEVVDPYYPYYIDGSRIDPRFVRNVSGDLYYFNYSDCYKLSNGIWENINVINTVGAAMMFTTYEGHGVTYGDYLIGCEMNLRQGFYSVIKMTPGDEKKTAWQKTTQVAVDITSSQRITGTKTFNQLLTDYIYIGNVGTNTGETRISLGKNTTWATSINMDVSGAFMVNNNPIATKEDCIENKTVIGYGPYVVDVANSGLDPGRYYQWVTNTGRMFNGNFEFVGGSWVPATPLQGLLLYGQYVVQAGSKTFYVYDGLTYLWDDANNEFVEIVQSAPSTGWDVWPCGDGVLRASSEYKLVNNGGTWSWESDPVQDYIRGMTYYIDGHVYVLSLSDGCVYEYDESNKTYEKLGRYSMWVDSSFSACGQIFFPYNGNEIRMIDFSLVDPLDPDKFIDVATGIPYSDYNYFYGEYDGKVYFYREYSTMSYCYDVQYAVPAVPATNGNYVLRATRSGDNITYSWVPEV